MKRLMAMLLCILLPILQLGADASRPLRILCIGDSITQGGVRGRQEYTYRLPLARTLHQLGIPFEMLGTQTEGLHPGFQWPELAEGIPFPARHEGYYGFTTEQVSGRIRANLPRLPDPDVVLIHLGTNDQRSRQPGQLVIRPLEEIITMLRERNPNIIILVGHIQNDGEAARRIRALKNEMAERLHRPEAPVLTVAHDRDWVANPRIRGTHTFDWLHPNPAGQKKMARDWLEALDRALELQHNSLPPEHDRQKVIRIYLENRKPSP